MRKYVGKNMKELQSETGTSPTFAGHCKAEIQQLVFKTIGLWLPRNDPNIAKKFQWEQGSVKTLVAEGKLEQSPLLSSTDDGNIDGAVFPSYCYDMKGTIIQVMFDKLKVPNAAHWHTAIISDYGKDSMTFLDVNYRNDNVCREHTITHKTFNDMCIAFRLYSIL